jgi:hypothetical protein
VLCDLYSNLSFTELAVLYERFGPPDTGVTKGDINGTAGVFDQLSDARRSLGMLVAERCIHSISLCSVRREQADSLSVSV